MVFAFFRVFSLQKRKSHCFSSTIKYEWNSLNPRIFFFFFCRITHAKHWPQRQKMTTKKCMKQLSRLKYFSKRYLGRRNSQPNAINDSTAMQLAQQKFSFWCVPYMAHVTCEKLLWNIQPTFNSFSLHKNIVLLAIYSAVGMNRTEIAFM